MYAGSEPTTGATLPSFTVSAAAEPTGDAPTSRSYASPWAAFEPPARPLGVPAAESEVSEPRGDPWANSPEFAPGDGPAYQPSENAARARERGLSPGAGAVHGRGRGDTPVYRPGDNFNPDTEQSRWEAGRPEDPFGLPVTGRRIEPSPPPRPRRLLPGLLWGLVIGLLVFGAAGWFLGRSTAPAATPPPTNSAQPLGAFERSQATINRADFAGTGLVTLSQGWLPYLSSCARSGRPSGPALNRGEKFRVRCTLDGMSAIFVEYVSIAERDRARQRMLDPSVDASRLAPGIVAPVDRRESPSGRSTGNYAEYAYRLTENGQTRTVSGIWWDDAETPVSGYVLGFWKEGLGERWAPMRDLWSRYA
jgi:hypothetical protein